MDSAAGVKANDLPARQIARSSPMQASFSAFCYFVDFDVFLLECQP
jgi:hypothetical protein